MTASGDPQGRPTNDLRQRAEQRVPKTATDVSGMSAAQIERLVYELEVHQEELEIQNEELRRTQTQLQAAHDRYADLYDFAPVGYLTVDADGSIVAANLTAARMLGSERSRIIGSRLALHCDPGSRIELRDHLKDVLASELSQSCELRFATLGGTTFDARLDSNRVASGTDDNWQCRMIVTDITRRKQAEQAALDKDKHLRSIADALPALIGYVDRELRFQFCNTAHEQWFGRSPAALQGQRVHDVFGEEFFQEIESRLADVLSGRRIEFESPLTHPVKGRRHLQIMLVPDAGPDGKVTGIHSLCIDVTERKVVEEQNERRRIFTERLVRLSAKESDVYEMLLGGTSNKAIAVALDIGLRTVERRRQVILEKLEVDSWAELLQQLAEIQGIEPNS